VTQLANFKFADDGSAHPSTVVPHDSPILTALLGDSSGTHGPAAPDLAKTFNVPGPVMSDAASDKFIFAENVGHDMVRGPQTGYDRTRSHRACRNPASPGRRARHECREHARPEPRDRTTRYDHGPVAAPPRRFSFCLREIPRSVPRWLGLTVPLTLRAAADEVIE